jgi:hypothetical protein
MLFDSDSEEPDDIVMDLEAPLELVNSRARRLDIQEAIMAFAVFPHPIGEVFQAPIFGLVNLASALREDGFHLLEKGLGLLARNVGSRNDDVLVERQVLPPYCFHWHGQAAPRFAGAMVRKERDRLPGPRFGTCPESSRPPP